MRLKSKDSFKVKTRNSSGRKLEKEIEKLNRLISKALEKGIKLTDIRILKQSNKVDILLIKSQR